ncbi:MAG TPA: glycosyltransferase family 4 protein [Pyrinomonadaceae bacterium]
MARMALDCTPREMLAWGPRPYARASDTLAMRILQICSAREIGGGERHLADLASALAGRGHEVFAALSPASPVRAELRSLPSENIIELPMRNSLNLASALRLSRFVREHQIEIVHAHVARDYPLAALATGRSQARLVLTRHVLFPLNRIHRLTLRRTSRVIAVSQAVAASLYASSIFAPEKIITIHNGLDINKFARAIKDPAPGRKLRVGMVGHIAPIKGQEDFVRAAAIVQTDRDDVEFIIAGEDKSHSRENRVALEKLIGDLKMDHAIKLTGWVDDVANLLSMLDLFVSPARSEPFGLSIVEAMAAGVPVVATASEGAREIIEDNQTGRLVPVGDSEAMAAAILDLLKARTDRKRLAENALVSLREHFSLDRMVERTVDVYAATLAG